MPKKAGGDPHMTWILDRKAGCGTIPKQMRVDGAAQILEGEFRNTVINAVSRQRFPVPS
jgi:hypothetical protein